MNNSTIVRLYKTLTSRVAAPPKKKGGPGAPKERFAQGLFRLAVVAVIGRQDDEAAVDGEGLQFDREAGTFFVREGGADFGPFFWVLPSRSYSSTVKTLRWVGDVAGAGTTGRRAWVG